MNVKDVLLTSQIPARARNKSQHIQCIINHYENQKVFSFDFVIRPTLSAIAHNIDYIWALPH